MAPDSASTKQSKAAKPKLAAETAASTVVTTTPVKKTAKTRVAETKATKTQGGAAGERAPGAKRIRHRPETRAQMLERLTNPFISLHEASVLLRVCPATVRRYTDSGELPHVRTEGGQRRFRLREVLLLMQQMEARRRKRH